MSSEFDKNILSPVEQFQLHKSVLERLGTLAARTVTSTADLNPEAPRHPDIPFEVTAKQLDDGYVSVNVERRIAGDVVTQLYRLPPDQELAGNVVGTVLVRTVRGKYDSVADHDKIRGYHKPVLELCLAALDESPLEAIEQPVAAQELAQVASY